MNSMELWPFSGNNFFRGYFCLKNSKWVSKI
jgi:hypothetical protein